MSPKASNIIIHLSVITACLADPTAPGIDRTVNDGVNSMGFNILYGDEEITVLNQVVDQVDKDVIKSKFKLSNSVPPLPAEDVKCLMSADKYCSSEMGHMKSVLIQAIKDDCKTCSTKEKDDVSKVMASVMAHDPTAWKIFLTRYVIQTMPEKKPPKPEKSRYRMVGEPEEVVSSKNRYTMPGVHVRVKRRAMEKIR